VDAKTGEYKELSDADLEWRLSIAASAADFGGVHLLPYKDQLIGLIKACWNKNNSNEGGQTKKQKKSSNYSKEIIHSAGELLRAVLTSLSYTWPVHYRPSHTQDRTQWGRMYTLKEVNQEVKIDWHVPNSQEIAVAKDIYNELMNLARKNLLEKNNNDRDGQLANLELIRHVIHGSQGLFPLTKVERHGNDDEPEVKNFPSIPFYSGVDESVIFSRQDVEILGNFIHEIREMIERDHPDDVESIRKLIEIYNVYLTNLHGSFQSFQNRLAQIHHKYRHPVRARKETNFSLVVDRVYSHHLNRVSSQNGGVSLTPQNKQLLDDLFKWSHSSYREIRKSAQSSLEKKLQGYPFCFRLYFQPLQLAKHSVR